MDARFFDKFLRYFLGQNFFTCPKNKYFFNTNKQIDDVIKSNIFTALALTKLSSYS
jgi:hypothetical protein